MGKLRDGARDLGLNIESPVKTLPGAYARVDAGAES